MTFSSDISKPTLLITTAVLDPAREAKTHIQRISLGLEAHAARDGLNSMGDWTIFRPNMEQGSTKFSDKFSPKRLLFPHDFIPTLPSSPRSNVPEASSLQGLTDPDDQRKLPAVSFLSQPTILQDAVHGNVINTENSKRHSAFPIRKDVPNFSAIAASASAITSGEDMLVRYSGNQTEGPRSPSQDLLQDLLSNSTFGFSNLEPGNRAYQVSADILRSLQPQAEVDVETPSTMHCRDGGHRLVDFEPNFDVLSCFLSSAAPPVNLQLNTDQLGLCDGGPPLSRSCAESETQRSPGMATLVEQRG